MDTSECHIYYRMCGRNLHTVLSRLSSNIDRRDDKRLSLAAGCIVRNVEAQGNYCDNAEYCQNSYEIHRSGTPGYFVNRHLQRF
ncbi:MAG: hypothetical protein EOM80_18655 [Erysipelotrichia bacterium]|nr:hypothetical protein [Erysipelotrichia bacterium]